MRAVVIAVAVGLVAADSRADLSPENVNRVVVAHVAEVRFCYLSELPRAPGLGGGTVTVDWTIAPTGEVSTASVARSTLNNANVEACVVGRVKTWHFAAVGSPVHVSYPFKFAG
jgi:TonB family protein